MKLLPTASFLCLSGAFAIAGRAAPSTGSPFYGDPPDAHHPWAIHDQNRPQPKRVEPGTFSSVAQPGQPPSDATVLFDGTPGSLANWESDTKPSEPSTPTKWIVVDGAMECVPKSGYIRTKAEFEDYQLHIEWAAPKNVKGDSQGRGNSGVFLAGIKGTADGPEVQVLDNYDNPTYADGFAASVYGTNPPLANALRPPGEFQVYDIVFRRPVYRDSQAIDPGYVTVFCNGVLVQDHTPFEGRGGHMKRTFAGAFLEKGPLKLQDHGNPVRYRNIWIRPLPPRTVQGGTDGYLSETATMAKRKEIAATVRADAAERTGTAQLLRLAESLCYENDPTTAKQVEASAAGYVAELKSLPPDQLEAKKSEARSVLSALRYLAKYNFVAASYPPKVALEKLEHERGWDQERK